MADGPNLSVPSSSTFTDTVRHDGPGQRRIGRGEAFGDGDDIRLQAIMLRAEHGAKATKTGDDFINDQQDIVFAQHGLNGLPIASWWRHNPTGAQHGLTDEGGYGIRAFLLDEGIKIVRALLDEIRFGHRQVVPAEIVRRVRMHNIRAAADRTGCGRSQGRSGSRSSGPSHDSRANGR